MSKMRFCSGDLILTGKIKRHCTSYFSNHCDKILGQKPRVEEEFILALSVGTESIRADKAWQQEWAPAGPSVPVAERQRAVSADAHVLLSFPL